MIGAAECGQWREPYQAGKTIQVHIKHNIQRGNESVMVTFPWTEAVINKKNEWKQASFLACKYTIIYICMSMYLRLEGITP